MPRNTRQTDLPKDSGRPSFWGAKWKKRMHHLQEKARRMFDLERGHSATVGVEDPDFREITSLEVMDADKWTGVSCLHGRSCLAWDGEDTVVSSFWAWTQQVECLWRISRDSYECMCCDRQEVLNELPCRGCTICIVRKQEVWSTWTQCHCRCRGSIFQGNNGPGAQGCCQVDRCQSSAWSWVSCWEWQVQS